MTSKHRIDTPAGATHASPDEDISIVLQHYLETEIQRRNIPGPIAPADFAEILLSPEEPIPHRQGCLCHSDRDYLHRIAQVAYERYTARNITQDVPTITIVPAPLTRRQTSDLLGNRLNYVMIFGAESIYFQDAVHALAMESHFSGGVNVLGAHIDWLSSDGKSIGRALAVDETGLVKEVAFGKPVPIHVVQILHLPLKRERQLHRELSAHFRDRGIPQINPYEGGSERADDKAWSHALWDQSEREIISPRFTLISQRSSPVEITDRLKAFTERIGKADVVVQPNKGTEGYKVKRFHGMGVGQIAPSSEIVRYIEGHVLSEDDAIVRETRGNVRYTKSLLNVAFRINVTWNGSEFVAESGYAQIAGDDRTFPASRGRGGTITDINEALANLYYPGGGSLSLRLAQGQASNEVKKWIRLIPTDEDIAAMKAAAVNAAYGLNAGLDAGNYLKQMGIDILLEVRELGANVVNVIPVVLEANPRPAGLAHSLEIIGISYKEPRPRISTEIFGFLGRATGNTPAEI